MATPVIPKKSFVQPTVNANVDDMKKLLVAGWKNSGQKTSKGIPIFVNDKGEIAYYYGNGRLQTRTGNRFSTFNLKNWKTDKINELMKRVTY